MKEITLEEAKRLFNLCEHEHDIDEINGDIVGRLYISEMLDSWRAAFKHNTEDHQLQRITEVVAAWIQETEKAEALNDAVRVYGMAEGQRGFREGFNIALNLIVQGMKFPTN